MRIESVILNTAVRVIFFLVNIFSVYLFFRGHNHPGGGFIAGLMTSISFVLLILSLGVDEFYKIFKPDPLRVAAWGLALAYGTAVAPMFFGYPFFKHFHWHIGVVPGLGDISIGTPLFFDLGVFFVVVGISVKMIVQLAFSIQNRKRFIRERGLD